MSVIVIGCGRTGSNLAVSLLSSNSKLNPSIPIENKNFFTSKTPFKSNYLCKADVTYSHNVEELINIMNIDSEMKLVWTMRDPRDVVMSKIKRGQPKKIGGDNNSSSTPFNDATPNGSLESIRKSYSYHKKILNLFPNRVFLIKMEDIILDTKNTTLKVCDFLNIEYEDDMSNFIVNMQNKYKLSRYGKKVDKNQVKLWKNWKTQYEGFFIKNNFNLEDLFKEVDDIRKYYNY